MPGCWNFWYSDYCEELSSSEELKGWLEEYWLLEKWRFCMGGKLLLATDLALCGTRLYSSESLRAFELELSFLSRIFSVGTKNPLSIGRGSEGVLF